MALEVTDMINSSGAVPVQWGDHTVINTQNGAIIDWSNFNTNVDQSVTFNQYMGALPDSSSAVLNRISSGTVPTIFNGVLNANGRVFVVNPAGVIFGAGSTINVNQLIASGLNMSNDAFRSVLDDEGKPMIFAGGSGQVENYGTIKADRVHLVGKRIVNMGTIAAPDGLVVMAAGDDVYLAQDGSNVLVALHESSENPADSIINEGSVNVGNGKIVLAAGDTFSSAIQEVDTLAAVSVDATMEENSQTTEDSDSDQANLIVACKTEPKPKYDPKPKPKCDPKPKPKCDPDDPDPDDPDPDDPTPDDPTPDPDIRVSALYAAAPIPEIPDVDYSGCPALMAWTANELGIDQRMMQIWTKSALASTQDIQPCQTCAKLRSVAAILNDAEGTHTAALAEVIGEFASRTDPPSPEEMTLIASAIADSGDDDSQYARARIYLDALSAYIGTLNNELNFSTEESILFAADRYIAPLAEESQNDALVAFIAARLAAYEG